MNIRPTDDDWMDLADVAKILGKTIDTIYNERYRGDDHPPSYLFKGKVRYRRSEVDAWIMAHRHVPAATQLASDHRTSAP